MAPAKRSQASLDSFFKKVQPPSVPVSNRPSSSTPRQAPPPHPPHSGIGSSNTAVVSSTSGAVPATPQDAAKLTSKSDKAEGLASSSTTPAIEPQRPSTTPSSSRIIKSSDDEGEDDDSDDSLVDLATLLRAHRPATQQNAPTTTRTAAPSTPNAPRFKNRSKELNSSPIIVPKYKFNLKYLANLAKADDATEASSKRIKALSTQKDIDSSFPGEGDSHEPKPNHLDLLGSVVTNQEDGEMQRVTRALKRTEATLSEQRWYFFDTQCNPPKRKRRSFPKKSLSEDWRSELLDEKSRHQTFISGFAEDMVSYGKVLPDEIFLWVLDGLCKEPSDPLRNSYSNVLRESSEQVRRLVGNDLIRSLFEGLGGSDNGISISEKVQPIPGLIDPYSNYEWNTLCSVIKFLGQVGRNVQQNSRVYTICILLRLSIDRVVFDNVDVLDQIHDTIGRLCRHIPDGDWESSCNKICSSIFESVEPATLRLQAVECVPSISPRTHDLRRRLAMSFYFDSISNSLKHSHHLMNLDHFIKRLEEPTFNITPQSDFRELTALVSLLDIAVDDARSIGVDLTDKEQERRFDKDIDDLAATIKDLMKSIGNPGAAFISKIEAKEVLELVAQRISDTLRSKPKPKDTIFDGPRRNDLEGERAGLQSFLSKMKKTEIE